MKQNVIETLTGFLVIVVALVFLIFAYRIGNISKVEDGYLIKANFQDAEGIVNGSVVMLAGIPIGSVQSVTLDKTNFFALLYMRINKDISLPKDSVAAVVTSGLFGNKYISISPGTAEENLKANDQIQYTQSAINIESLVSKLIYSFSSK